MKNTAPRPNSLLKLLVAIFTWPPLTAKFFLLHFSDSNITQKGSIIAKPTWGYWEENSLQGSVKKVLLPQKCKIISEMGKIITSPTNFWVLIRGQISWITLLTPYKSPSSRPFSWLHCIREKSVAQSHRRGNPKHPEFIKIVYLFLHNLKNC